jgi:hypothetical protein
LPVALSGSGSFSFGGTNAGMNRVQCKIMHGAGASVT